MTNFYGNGNKHGFLVLSVMICSQEQSHLDKVRASPFLSSENEYSLSLVNTLQNLVMGNRKKETSLPYNVMYFFFVKFLFKFLDFQTYLHTHKLSRC